MDIRSIKTACRQLFTEPKEVVMGLWQALGYIIPDSLYLRVLFRQRVGYWPSFSNPKTMNEKLNWLKLHNRKQQYSIMVDKYAVKQYVTDVIGEEYVVPCLGVWDDAKLIDFSKLPNQFVLKTTHNSCATLICRDKNTLQNIDTIKGNFNHYLSKNPFDALGEWPYKNVPPRIIAEQLLDNKSGDVLQDYKWWCFNGEPTFMYFSVKNESVYENFYDMNFQPVTWINHKWPRRKPEFDKPAVFEEMKILAKKLSKDIPFVRVDFYLVDSKIYFGELTFFDWAGLRPFCNYETDLRIGGYLNIK